MIIQILSQKNFFEDIQPKYSSHTNPKIFNSTHTAIQCTDIVSMLNPLL